MQNTDLNAPCVEDSDATSTATQQIFQIISNHATKGEIAAWSRKRKSIERVINVNIRPLEDAIIETNAQLIPLYDQLSNMRAEMVDFCIHPVDMLVYKQDHVECKFCTSKLGVPTIKV